MKDDRDSAEELFGSIRRIRAIGGHQIDMLELNQPLEWENGIMRLFCEGCGNLVEINHRFAEVLIRSLNRRIPNSPEEFFFKSRRCGYCDGKDDVIELLPLPRIDS